MPETAAPTLGGLIRRAAVPLTGHATDHDALMEMVGDARVVLLGEATHGTHEFYHERARITQRLIDEKGFTAVAVEADWPDAYRVNRYVRGIGDDASPNEALSDFKRFPTWMWRNVDVLNLVGWLREYNDSLAEGKPKVGFYGLDLYSLYSSIEAVVHYLDEVDPEAARRARRRYACFEHFGEDSQAYGYSAELGIAPSCEEEAVRQLRELRERAGELARGVPDDEHFYAEQNARLVKNAEEYYRSMFRGRVSSWNLRDCHMADTLEALLRHLAAKGQDARVVVWEHNSHIGDARATEMGEEGEWNVGQLARERWERDVVLVGFTTHTGTVTAASDWDEPPQLKRVRPALAGSYEALLHAVEIPRFFLPLRDGGALAEAFGEHRLERAIGVIYLPRSERVSHYFHARLARQFDAVIHVDETRAVEPLEINPEWRRGDTPE
ncbi:MAG: erythromycin esterase family protein, partial [Gemmatimonadota bacterium]|nr:erythromycin esterase family protein [Gemmatimonadota bacterium]